MGTTEWKKVDSPPTEPPPPELKLVRHEQVAGEPYHWSPFLAREGQPGGDFQVRGDAVAMKYAHTNNTDVLSSQSCKDSYIIAQLAYLPSLLAQLTQLSATSFHVSRLSREAISRNSRDDLSQLQAIERSYLLRPMNIRALAKAS